MTECIIKKMRAASKCNGLSFASFLIQPNPTFACNYSSPPSPPSLSFSLTPLHSSLFIPLGATIHNPLTFRYSFTIHSPTTAHPFTNLLIYNLQRYVLLFARFPEIHAAQARKLRAAGQSPSKDEGCG